MIVRRVADGAAIALCLSVLTGCIFSEGITSGLTTVKRDGANILVAACADTVATRMTFSEQLSGIEEGDERFWAFEREIELRRGDVLSSDPAVTPPVPGEIRRTPLLLPDDSLYVSFSNQDDSVLEISGYFHLPSEGFSESSGFMKTEHSRMTRAREFQIVPIRFGATSSRSAADRLLRHP